MLTVQRNGMCVLHFALVIYSEVTYMRTQGQRRCMALVEQLVSGRACTYTGRMKRICHPCVEAADHLRRLASCSLILESTRATMTPFLVVRASEKLWLSTT